MKNLLLLLVLPLLFSCGGSLDKKLTLEMLEDGYTGQGTFTYAHGYNSNFHGEKYVGEWNNGNMHGQGTFTYSNGGKFIGEWKDNKMHGQGTLSFANGDKIIGEWKDGKRHGQGTITSGDGTKRRTYEVTYKDDKIIKVYGKMVNTLENKTTN